MDQKERIKNLKLRFAYYADAMENTGDKKGTFPLTKEDVDAIHYCLYQECSYYEED